VAGFYVETRDYAASASFWRSLGFEAVFETDHSSGQFVHPDGGPYVFLAEHDERRALKTHVILAVDDAAAFPLAEHDVRREFTPQHWGVLEAVVRDPDKRDVSLQAPLPPERS
jgi:catechol 2,3-dioxygenase-like lactoylglutathione lyase family enzyme